MMEGQTSGESSMMVVEQPHACRYRPDGAMICTDL